MDKFSTEDVDNLGGMSEIESILYFYFFYIVEMWISYPQAMWITLVSSVSPNTSCLLLGTNVDNLVELSTASVDNS